MPFGCGEQNMLLFAPNVFVSRYLKETGQLKPEVMAKAEVMMLTGYQRELTYRRDDGSFSAFGQNDKGGSLWLTGFVLKTFAQGRDLIYVDEGVLSSAQTWIRDHQQADGSFVPVGFVHHQELLGGLKGKGALTAFAAVALREAGDSDGAARAERYLEGSLDGMADAYTLAIATYALALGKSARARAARDKLMALAKENDAGLYWGDLVVPTNPPATPPVPTIPTQMPSRSAAIETTGYAALALLQLGETLDAGRAIRWLASQRNAQGGFGSTQDTVVALQAMTAAATSSRGDIDATVAIQSGSWRKELKIAADNADVLQVIDVPVDPAATVEVRGKGQIQAQVVRRFNLPAVETTAQPVFRVSVSYGAEQVQVNDLITVTANVAFNPPEPVAAGMVVLDIAVPTGFEAVEDSLRAAVSKEPRLKRFDVAGRKVIFYIEDMQPNDRLQIAFQARALYPVKAQPVSSQAYAYYRPEWKGEVIGGKLTVAGQ
jgi:CD109 antigen